MDGPGGGGGMGGRNGGIAADFDDESPAGKPKFTGVSRRKAAQQGGFLETGGDDGFGGTTASSGGQPPQGRRRDGGGAGGAGGGARAAPRSKHDELDDAGEQDIMEIPELDEDAGFDEDDITTQVAAVPKYRANRVQTIGELDEEAHMLQRADDEDDDIDFSLLTSVLHSMEQVREGDEVWDPERIWGEIKRELHLEEEEREALNEGLDAGGGGAGAGGNKAFTEQEMTSTKM